ncbi:hypothetical protein [Natronococcus occultus]|uniref:Uncharacterized protein n=1 Tax=Natronococcus occultus SP4 TaxID=694430 RepID=L0JZV9_9EURY|nr:hypothetical protein [Natronococcus occultus]AGB37644.1 hypothetical protein Natoc_1850 [Natronococcus occultus SP4]
MGIDDTLSALPDPGGHSFPDYSLPKGDPVLPIAVTREELQTVLELYDTFAAVDPTGLDSNPFLRSTTRFLEQTFGTPVYRPDEQLVDDIAAMLNDFSDDLAGEAIGVVDATPKHHKTLYFFLTSCRAYHTAPHIQFRPAEDVIDTLYEIYERVLDQEMYLKRPQTVLE